MAKPFRSLSPPINQCGSLEEPLGKFLLVSFLRGKGGMSDVKARGALQKESGNQPWNGLNRSDEHVESRSPCVDSLCSKRFRGARSEERGFRRCARAKNGARAKIGRRGFFSSHCNSLFPICTETLATQESKKSILLIQKGWSKPSSSSSSSSSSLFTKLYHKNALPKSRDKNYITKIENLITTKLKKYAKKVMWIRITVIFPVESGFRLCEEITSRFPTKT